MSISVSKAMSKPDGAPARRIELFTGVGHRRIWSADEKAAIVAESYSGADKFGIIALININGFGQLASDTMRRCCYGYS